MGPPSGQARPWRLLLPLLASAEARVILGLVGATPVTHTSCLPAGWQGCRLSLWPWASHSTSLELFPLSLENGDEC